MAKPNKGFVQNAEEEKKKRRKGLFSKIIVVSVITLNVIFAVLFVFLKTSCEPTGLVASWFSFTTVELWSLAGIKKAKEKNPTERGSNKWQIL